MSMSALLISLFLLTVHCSLKIYYFDIGQGDSQLVIYPSGFTVLIDVGPDNSAETIVYKRLVELLGSQPKIDVLSLFVFLIVTLSYNTLSY